jgi:HEXXH motif-containing protein
MTLRHHRVSGDAFQALAAGGGGSGALRELAAAQYSKHVLLLRGVLGSAERAGHGQASLARAGYALLADVQRHDPGAFDVVIRHPSVGAWALRTLRGLRSGPALPAAEPAWLCAVAAAAAIRAGLPAEIEVSVLRGAVLLPSLGAAEVPGDMAMVRTAAKYAEVVSAGRRVQIPADPHQGAPGWSALRRLRAGSVEVLIDDLDPFRMPGTTDVAPRQAPAEVRMWDSAFQETWSLLERHHPGVAGEAAAAIRVIVPLAMPRRGQVSSSSVENFGAVALSPPPDPRTFAVTLAHEVQHLKLSALVDIVPLTLPDDGRCFYAPWREDPRPVSGLLQGAYAHLGVSGFWRRQRHLDDGPAGLRAHAEFARWRAAAARVVDTLRSSGQLTPAGLDFAAGMARTLRSWQDEPVPGEAQALAREEAEQHLASWRSAHGPVPA